MIIAVNSLHAQIEQPVKWSYAAKKIAKDEAVIFIKATIDEGWHIYAMDQKPGGPVKASFQFMPSADYQLIGQVTEPQPRIVYDAAFDINDSFFERDVIFRQKIKLKNNQAIVKGKVNFMVCNDHQCLPASDVEFSIPIK